AAEPLVQRLHLLQHRRHQLADGRVDVHRAGNRGVGLLGGHDVEDRVNDLVAADTENGRPEDEFGFGVDHHLHEALGLPLLHGSPYTCHRSFAHQGFSAGFANRVHGHACAAEWRGGGGGGGGGGAAPPPAGGAGRVGGGGVRWRLTRA